MDGIAKAKERGVHFGRKPELTAEKVAEIKSLRAEGTTVPDILRQVGLSKASVYRALNSFPSNPLATKGYSN
jgi:DNA invertase Pin-like site-specific DNA recombinase